MFVVHPVNAIHWTGINGFLEMPGGLPNLGEPHRGARNPAGSKGLRSCWAAGAVSGDGQGKGWSHPANWAPIPRDQPEASAIPTGYANPMDPGDAPFSLTMKRACRNRIWRSPSPGSPSRPTAVPPPPWATPWAPPHGGYGCPAESHYRRGTGISPTSRSYSLPWCLVPYSKQVQAERGNAPWKVSCRCRTPLHSCPGL